jgi:hypothetical protein
MPWARIALSLSALLLIPLVIALIVLAAKFKGLGVNLAMEHAQVARRVAAGEGLTTGSVRPISLALHPNLQKHPDLVHAPAHPLLLGLVFAILHPSDRVAAAFGLLLWAASVILTFWVARRWYGPKVAALAAAFYGGNVAMLKASVLGMPYPLSAMLVLIYAVVAAPDPREEAATSETGSDARTIGAGLIAGLAAMTNYLFFFFAPVMGAQMAASRRRRGRAALLFAAGFAAILLPWMIRNLRWARSPFFSFYWYEALAGTDDYPADTVWRSLAAAGTGPWEFAFLHPLQMFRKISTGLLRIWQESLAYTDPVVAFLFVAALARGQGSRPWKGWMAAVTGGMVLSTLASSVFRAEPELLLAWTPLLAIPAAAQLATWVARRVEEVSLRRYWSFRVLPTLFQEPAALRTLLRRSAAAAVLAVIGFPLFHYLWVYRPEPSPLPDSSAFTQSIPPQATVMTDQPALVAWRGERRAVWLCLEEKDWDQIEAGGGPITATYMTPAAAGMVPSVKAGWWWWISSPRGIYRDLAPVEAARLPGVLRLRKG